MQTSEGWDMGSDETTIGALIEATGGSIKTGPFGTKLKASEYSSVGVPVISVGEVGTGRLRIHHDTPRVDTSIVRKMPEFVLMAGDIVFGRKGAVERSALVQPHEEGCFLGSDGIRVRLDPAKCDTRFVAYQLQTRAHRAWMIQHAAGTTMPSLNEGIIRRIPIVTPSLQDQRAIASVLGALDDKIDLNRRMCQTLEEMARALFKSWFVDFDPVRAKMEGRDPGLPKEIADLFPSRLVDSALGPIPEGWRVVSLSDLVEVSKGASYTSAELQPSSVALLSLKSFVRGGGYRDGGLKPFVGRYKEGQVVACGDVVMPCTDVTQAAELIGRTARVPQIDDYEIIVASTDVLVLRPSVGSVPRSWLALLGRSPRFVAAMLAHSTGTTVLHLAREAIPSFLTVVPPTTLLARFDEHVSPLMRRSDLCQNQNRTLAALRDTLLPKLISGELRIPASLGSMQEVAS